MSDVCAGCGAKYPSEVPDLFKKPGTDEEYCKDCAGPLMLADYLASQKAPPCPYCDADGILGTKSDGTTLFCPWCEKGRELGAGQCIYCFGTGKIKASDGEMDCIMCPKARPKCTKCNGNGVWAYNEKGEAVACPFCRPKLMTTKEGLGAVRD